MDIEEYSRHIHFYTDYVPPLLLEYLGRVEWKSFADIGCGDGALLFALDKRGCFRDRKVFAIDLSAKRIELVKKINPEFICQVNSACELESLAENSVDFLVSTQVIEHVPDDRMMVREIGRVLSEGGTVYLSTVFKKWYGWYFYRCNGRWVLDPTHLREYTGQSQLTGLLDREGFAILENRTSLIWFPLIDFFLRRISSDRKFYARPLSALLGKIKIPIPGYYPWELVFRSM
jgi:2-polyprenyl-3-methyl-5-hydroxy-6-metoxy-1,4-benzoquinol methylase